jgi:hypothetical protein
MGYGLFYFIPCKNCCLLSRRTATSNIELTQKIRWLANYLTLSEIKSPGPAAWTYISIIFPDAWPLNGTCKIMGGKHGWHDGWHGWHGWHDGWHVWRSSESVRLWVWIRLSDRTRRYMWVELFVGSLPCFSGHFAGLLSLCKIMINISKSHAIGFSGRI